MPACLLSLPVRGEGAGDELSPIDLPELSGTPVLLINPRVALATADVFARWDGVDHGSLEDWREGRNDLEAPAIALAPNQPLILNFLGYAKLERGEDMEAAEAMIRKASELSPDNASIIDSLGWAQFKRGKVGEAIETLQQAAGKDPDQAEIQEHLGDALYKSGRRYEARFAWNAALVTAEDDMAARVKAKLTSGLTQANAAP